MGIVVNHSVDFPFSLGVNSAGGIEGCRALLYGYDIRARTLHGRHIYRIVSERFYVHPDHIFRVEPLDGRKACYRDGKRNGATLLGSLVRLAVDIVGTVVAVGPVLAEQVNLDFASVRVVQCHHEVRFAKVRRSRSESVVGPLGTAVRSTEFDVAGTRVQLSDPEFATVRGHALGRPGYGLVAIDLAASVGHKDLRRPLFVAVRTDIAVGPVGLGSREFVAFRTAACVRRGVFTAGVISQVIVIHADIAIVIGIPCGKSGPWLHLFVLGHDSAHIGGLERTTDGGVGVPARRTVGAAVPTDSVNLEVGVCQGVAHILVGCRNFGATQVIDVERDHRRVVRPGTRPDLHNEFICVRRRSHHGRHHDDIGWRDIPFKRLLATGGAPVQAQAGLQRPCTGRIDVQHEERIPRPGRVWRRTQDKPGVLDGRSHVGRLPGHLELGL